MGAYDSYMRASFDRFEQGRPWRGGFPRMEAADFHAMIISTAGASDEVRLGCAFVVAGLPRRAWHPFSGSRRTEQTEG
jgi:hypothetical protein